MAEIYFLNQFRENKAPSPSAASYRTQPYHRPEDEHARLNVFSQQFVDKRLYVVFPEKTSGKRGFHVFCFNASANLADKNAKPASYEFMPRREFMQNFHSPKQLRHGLSNLFQLMAVEDTRASRFERPDVYQRSIHSIEQVVKEGRLPHSPALKVQRNQLLVHFQGCREAELMSPDEARENIGVVDPVTRKPASFDF